MGKCNRERRPDITDIITNTTGISVKSDRSVITLRTLGIFHSRAAKNRISTKMLLESVGNKNSCFKNGDANI